ncbi:Rpn family recombination-promoting nuclease/putative transposase [Desulfosporosinus youngiae]|uniref:Putative transposase n=1 Tax=Desulfosporosinus youngiae DSM 17734 TaxID=768710 RepID=H5Y689_9FIRM|nr:Rpn family recombination-promoting nuclease/putative transposase [Desulfosporosinus youngiae]EHQ91099.1 putative transposase [Desulfosporosinus youngiae DSM 17734]
MSSFEKNKGLSIPTDDGFLMSPKIDFVFKLIFGQENNKDLLLAFLKAVLGDSADEYEGIEIINNELLREFAEDRKGILDVRAKTKSGKQIDIEIQILPTQFMPERTLFYWSKMFTSQVKPGDTYDRLKKCITINIVDFICTPLPKLYSAYHLTEDKTGYRLTDILEVHFLEIAKLADLEISRDLRDPVVEWMEFLDAKSKGVIEMLAEKNQDIKKAYDLLQIISKDEKARMLYEAREAELRDQLTRLKVAEDKGRAEGMNMGETQKALSIAEKMLRRGDSVEEISELTELSPEKVAELKDKLFFRNP